MAGKQLHLWLAAAAMLLAISDASLTKNATKQFLRAHNEARAAVGVDPLLWSKKMASYASKLASHSPGSASCELSQEAASCEYGANQAVANWFDGPAAVVGSWVDEGRRYYNYGYNSCAVGHQNECESYTQVVWKKTVKLGCGKANCGKDGSHVICLYSPPGNVPGERPY
ncbi:hypothetical protein KFK09_004684 [Dendrobium nobile]|uniref:SCP domain-containing protein n=1 Tax=Dendrobium nobile TaxID=94219 RepID=A0A8T3C6S4_DENNO|nr:hypothetical protein KFK09_004684 [Dendrobium nobile]